MHAFRDQKDRQWEVVINVGAVKRVRDLLKVDLYALMGDGLRQLGELLGDPCQFVDVLFVLCQAQAAKVGVSDVDFGESLGGDSLERAAEAFVEELIDFFPNPRVRESLRQVVQKGRETLANLAGRAEAELAKVDPEMLAETLLRSFTSSPGSSALTQPLSPSPS